MRLLVLILLLAALHPLSWGADVPIQRHGEKYLSLSEEEADWLARHKTIRVSLSRPDPDKEYFAGDLYQGMAYDYLTAACRRLGITVVPVADLSWTSTLDLVREKNGVDVVLGISPSLEHERYLEFTSSYLTSPHVIFTRRKDRIISGVADLAGTTVIVQRGKQTRAELEQQVPGIKFLEVPTSIDGLKALSTGEADALVESLALGTYDIQRSGIANVKVAAPAPSGSDELAIGVRKDWPELARLLDRAIYSLSSDEHSAIRHRWLTLRYEHGLRARDVALWGVLVGTLALAWIGSLRGVLKRRTAALEAEVLLRSQREKELEREKRFVDSVIESLPVLFYLHDGRTLLRWNSAFEQTMGLSARELTEVHLLSLIHEEDRELTSTKRKEIFELGSATWEARVLTPEGPRYHLITGRKMTLDGVEYAVGSAKDISDHKLAERALRESDRRFREMLQNLRLIAVIFDNDDRLTFCNDFLLELTGWRRADVIGKNWFRMFHPDPAEAQRAFHEGFLHGAGYLHRERTILTRDGARRVISWNSTLLRNPFGQQVGMACIGEDITDRRQYENALHNISVGVSAATGSAFFQSLVRHLAQSLEVDFAVIARRVGESGRMSTVAVSAKGETVPNFEYEMSGSPCETIEREGLFIVEKGVALLYPEVPYFVEMGVESLAGVPLRNPWGDFLGVLTVLSRTPFANRDLVEAMLGIFAVRAAVEMERTRGEEALRESEQRYRLLFDRMLNGYAVHEVIFDDGGKPVDYRFLEVNASYETLTGFTREQLIGKTVLELMPQTEDFWIARFGAVAQNEQPDQFEAYTVALNKWLKVAAYSPQPGQFAATFADVTKRKVTERALLESEEHVRQIFDQNDDGVLLFRMDSFEIIDANPAALKLFGASREDLKHMKPWGLISPSDFRRLIRSLARDGERIFQLERATSYRLDGTRFIVAIRGKVLTLRNEYVILCSVRDSTEKARLEDEMKATQAKLIQANKMTSLGMLVSGIAHEINNPNNFISVNALMLSDVWSDAAPILREHFEREGNFTLGGLPFCEMESVVPRLCNGITQGSSRIASIVSNMRNFVRKDEGGGHGAIDINRSVENASSLLWHHIHRHTDSFAMSLTPDLPQARGNGQQIEQVVINLIMNALQALPGKEQGVRVTTGLDEETGMITVSVIDEGYGMNKKVRKRLAEPFFSTRIDKGGTGLGLYISSSIIKEHSGTLSFDSAPGRGTVATIRLPREDMHPAPPAP